MPGPVSGFSLVVYLNPKRFFSSRTLETLIPKALYVPWHLALDLLESCCLRMCTDAISTGHFFQGPPAGGGLGGVQGAPSHQQLGQKLAIHVVKGV